MANAKTYNVDPNVFLATAAAGTAQSPADRSAAAWAKILAATNQAGAMGYETLDTTAASLAVDVYESQLTISGTMAFTLPDGTAVGQRKRVVAMTVAATPLCTLTVTTPETVAGFACAATFIFNTAGQAIEFVWTGTKWRVTRLLRAGVLAVVIGTTVLTGFNLNLNYACSVTGSVDSTGTKGLPNGSVAGERCVISNPTAATIPVGSLDGVYTSLLGVAATHLQAIGATTDTAVLEWDGQAWQILYSTGITVA